MTYSPLAVANYFLKRAQSSGEALTPMKLQKLVYYAHGWYLALSGGTALISSPVYAWDYGPVIREVYDEFKHYGRSSIDALALNPLELNQPYDIHGNGKQSIETFLNSVWNIYGKQTAVQLSNATHKEGTPWRKIYRSDQRDLVIGNDIIQSYFEGLKKK